MLTSWVKFCDTPLFFILSLFLYTAGWSTEEFRRRLLIKMACCPALGLVRAAIAYSCATLQHACRRRRCSETSRGLALILGLERYGRIYQTSHIRRVAIRSPYHAVALAAWNLAQLGSSVFPSIAAVKNLTTKLTLFRFLFIVRYVTKCIIDVGVLVLFSVCSHKLRHMCDSQRLSAESYAHIRKLLHLYQTIEWYRPTGWAKERIIFKSI